MNEYLAPTKLLNYDDHSIIELIEKKNWRQLPEEERIRRIYQFVKDDILFGYNEGDEIPASKVLKDGYGQCNTKTVLFMALLRAVGIPTRFHGFTIDKILQKGAIDGIIYKLTPKELIHSWAEVYYQDAWLDMEGFILDNAYLSSIQEKFKDCKGSFCGYAIATEDIENPQVEWAGKDTYIQKDAIIKDLGVFLSPDEFYRKCGSNLSGLKKILFKYVIRKMMNKTVNKLRNQRNRIDGL